MAKKRHNLGCGVPVKTKQSPSSVGVILRIENIRQIMADGDTAALCVWIKARLNVDAHEVWVGEWIRGYRPTPADAHWREEAWQRWFRSRIEEGCPAGLERRPCVVCQTWVYGPEACRRRTCSPKCSVAAHRAGNTTRRGWRKCAGCGGLFQAVRKAQWCCGHPCRTVALRRRAKVARLRQAGYTWAEVAAACKTTPATVKMVVPDAAPVRPATRLERAIAKLEPRVRARLVSLASERGVPFDVAGRWPALESLLAAVRGALPDAPDPFRGLTRTATRLEKAILAMDPDDRALLESLAAARGIPFFEGRWPVFEDVFGVLSKLKAGVNAA